MTNSEARKRAQARNAPDAPRDHAAEALAGVLAGGAVAAALAHFWYLPTIPLEHALPLAILCACVGQLGDLVESLLKRSTAIKDSGNILPGHGGLLDRIDGLLFVAPIVYLYGLWLGPLQ